MDQCECADYVCAHHRRVVDGEAMCIDCAENDSDHASNKADGMVKVTATGPVAHAGDFACSSCRATTTRRRKVADAWVWLCEACGQSKPAPYVPSVGDAVEYEGKAYVVREVNAHAWVYLNSDDAWQCATLPPYLAGRLRPATCDCTAPAAYVCDHGHGWCEACVANSAGAR